ncbi:MAG TPA: hypothetical protein VJO34_14555 [Methylomirabilota bacterium]|nr:hypothetical protein [Methylomirabilota bacterium]
MMGTSVFERGLRPRKLGGGFGREACPPPREKDVDGDDVDRAVEAFPEITRGWK